MSDFEMPIWEKVVREGAGSRAPFDPPDASPELSEQPKPREEAIRSKGPTTRSDTREEQAARPCVIYVGTVSENIEVGVGSPTTVGQMIRRIRLRARRNVAASPSNYWTLKAFWYDSAGTPQLMGEFSTLQQSIPKNSELAVWHEDAGIRIETLNEVTLKFVKTGSAPSIRDVTLYPDWFVGI